MRPDSVLWWKRNFDTITSELRHRGYTAQINETGSSVATERYWIRIGDMDGYLDLYLQDGYWTFNRWLPIDGQWKETSRAETVQKWDHSRVFYGPTPLEAGTPHETVINTLEINLALRISGSDAAARLERVEGEQLTNDEHSRAVVEGALRYFTESDPDYSASERVMIPSTYVRGVAEDERRWDGYITVQSGYLGFLEESDCLAADVQQGTPLIFPLNEIKTCSVLIPTDMTLSPNLSRLSPDGTSDNFICHLGFTQNRRFRFAVWVHTLPRDMKKEALEDLQLLVAIIDKSLTLADYRM